MSDDVANHLVNHTFVATDEVLHLRKVRVEDGGDLGGSFRPQLTNDLFRAVKIGKHHRHRAELASLAACHARRVKAQLIEQARREKRRQRIQAGDSFLDMREHRQHVVAAQRGHRLQHERTIARRWIDVCDLAASLSYLADVRIRLDRLIGGLINKNLAALGLVFGMSHVGQRLAHYRVFHLFRCAQVGREQRPRTQPRRHLEAKGLAERLHLAKAGDGLLHLRSGPASADRVIVVEKGDQQSIAAELEQVAALPRGDVEHGGEKVADDARDFLRALFAPPRKPLRHGRKARHVSEHDRSLAKLSAHLSRPGIAQLLVGQVTRQISRHSM